MESIALNDRVPLEQQADMAVDGVTRRDALNRFAMLIGGAAASSSGLSALAASLPVAPAGGFNERRRRIFQGLAECYDGMWPITLASGRDLAAEMAIRYAAKDPGYRRWVDSLLDAVDSAPNGARFADRDLAGQKQILLTWCSEREPDDDLLFRLNPHDASLPQNLHDYIAALSEAIKKAGDALSPSERELDPETALPRCVVPKPEMHPLPKGGPVGTPVRLRRQLCDSSRALIASFLVDDMRYYV